jgi:hypothetical protein
MYGTVTTVTLPKPRVKYQGTLPLTVWPYGIGSCSSLRDDNFLFRPCFVEEDLRGPSSLAHLSLSSHHDVVDSSPGLLVVTGSGREDILLT